MANFSDEEIQAVWEKARICKEGWNGRFATEWRVDIAGAWIRRSGYGKQENFGWEIDHINPNGGDNIENLQPLYWENNSSKGDNYPTYETAFTSFEGSDINSEFRIVHAT